MPHIEVEFGEEPDVDALDEGDEVEFGFSALVHIETGEAWLKLSAKTTVWEGETGPDAFQRIADYVMAEALQAVESAMGD